MRGMNRVTLVGNLGRDPELKVLADGVEVAKFPLATTEIFRGKEGQLRSDTQWHSVIAWRGLAGLAKAYLRTGSLVLVEGRIRYRMYEDKAGLKKYITEIVADQLIMLDRKVPAQPSGHESDDESLPF